MGTTTPLRRALRQQFHAFVEGAGFTIDARDQPGTTVFRRSSGAMVQLFEVHWDKYGRPRFCLHFGTCPAAGLRINAELHAPERVYPAWCPDSGSLQPRPGATSRSWFRQDRPLLQRLLQRSALREPSEVVGEVISRFPELERYWSTGQIGTHMHIWNLPTRGVARNAA